MRTSILAPVVCGLLLVACSDDSGQGELATQGDVDAAKHFEEFQLPWLGEEFEGMPLAIVKLPGSRRGPAYLTYGRCDEEDPESGCTYELDIQADPYPGRGQGALPRRRISGVPARWEAGYLELIGDRLTVSLTGDRRRQVLRAARRLQPANEAPATAPSLTDKSSAVYGDIPR